MSEGYFRREFLNEQQVRQELEERVAELEGALRYVDEQLADAIGKQCQTITPGAAYRVRDAVYGNGGGPRPKDAALSDTGEEK